jgi:hypothetical protein
MVALRPPVLSPSPRWPATLCRSQSRINAGTAAPGALFYNHQNYHNGGISLASDLQWIEAAFSSDHQTRTILEDRDRKKKPMTGRKQQ